MGSKISLNQAPRTPSGDTWRSQGNTTKMGAYTYQQELTEEVLWMQPPGFPSGASFGQSRVFPWVRLQSEEWFLPDRYHHQIVCLPAASRNGWGRQLKASCWRISWRALGREQESSPHKTSSRLLCHCRHFYLYHGINNSKTCWKCFTF